MPILRIIWQGDLEGWTLEGAREWRKEWSKTIIEPIELLSIIFENMNYLIKWTEYIAVKLQNKNKLKSINKFEIILKGDLTMITINNDTGEKYGYTNELMDFF